MSNNRWGTISMGQMHLLPLVWKILQDINFFLNCQLPFFFNKNKKKPSWFKVEIPFRSGSIVFINDIKIVCLPLLSVQLYCGKDIC